MENVQFRKLMKEFREEGLLEVSNAKGATTVFVELAVFALLCWGLASVEAFGLWFWVIQILAGCSLFRWFVILHECGHKTLFRASMTNSVVGHVASVLCLVPYVPWRNTHMQHHRWVGVIDKDPTQKHLLNLQKASEVQNRLFRIVWKLWLPIPFAMFLFEVFWGYPVAMLKEKRTKDAWKGAGSVLVCVLGQLLAIEALGLKGWATYFLPMLAVFYFLIENMNLPQHSELFPYLSDTHPDPIPFSAQDDITRSTHLPDWISTVLALNFNRHTEHHMFATAPWYSLNEIRRRLLREGYEFPHEVEFVHFMWELRQRDPLTIYRDALPKSSDAAQ